MHQASESKGRTLGVLNDFRGGLKGRIGHYMDISSDQWHQCQRQADHLFDLSAASATDGRCSQARAQQTEISTASSSQETFAKSEWICFAKFAEFLSKAAL